MRSGDGQQRGDSDERSSQRTPSGYRRHGAECFADRTSLHRPPVYYGFVVLDDVAVDGFTLGKITDFEAEPCDEGDAFVIAPDGGRAGLVWEVCDPSYFREVMPIEAGRWGVCGVGFRLPMNSRENARRNLESILPELTLRWAEWKSQFQGGGAPMFRYRRTTCGVRRWVPSRDLHSREAFAPVFL
jgi:hypothetical protein